MVIPPAVLLGTTAECLNGGIRSKQPVPLEGLSFIGLWVMITCFFGSVTNFLFFRGGGMMHCRMAVILQAVYIDFDER